MRGLKHILPKISLIKVISCLFHLGEEEDDVKIVFSWIYA